MAEDSGVADNFTQVNLTALLLNTTSNSTGDESNVTVPWLTHEEVEHFLGDPDVDHALALVLGAISVVYGRRLPQLLAGVASISLGLWVGLVVQDRQVYNNPLFNKIELPEGAWVPIVAGVLSGAAAAVLCKIAWKAALALLTAGIVMLLALSVCRLFNVSPDRVFSIGANLLSAYRVVGSIVLVLGILGSVIAVKKLHKYMIEFASAFLGTLLLLSGVSHFATRVGNDAPFSLLDDLARIISEVRSNNCDLWDNDEAHHLEKCDCEAECQTEICAWIASSLTVLVVRWLKTRLQKAREARLKKAGEEERAPLSGDVDTPGGAQAEGSPVAGASSASVGSARGRGGSSRRHRRLQDEDEDETPRAQPAPAKERTPRASPPSSSPASAPPPQVVGNEGEPDDEEDDDDDRGGGRGRR